MIRVLVSLDKFRGTAGRDELNRAVSAALTARGHETHIVPLADGGEGSLDVVGGPNKSTTVAGPLGDPVNARWRLDSKVAHIEMAAASGLALVGGAEHNDALAASTTGTGQLINQALRLGAEEIVVYHGGSATTDGGWGAIEALSSRSRLRRVSLRAATDVNTRFADAARVFGPQKGASKAEVRLLERRLGRLADLYRSEFGVDVDRLEGAGAAGGLAGGLAAVGATIESGFDVLAGFAHLDEQLLNCDLVITGEGCIDDTTVAGKMVGRLARRSRLAGIPVVAIAGQVDLAPPDGVEFRSLSDSYGPGDAMSRTVELVTAEAVAAVER